MEHCETLEVLLSINRIGVFVSVLQTWLQGGKKESARQLSEMQAYHYAEENELIF